MTDAELYALSYEELLDLVLRLTAESAQLERALVSAECTIDQLEHENAQLELDARIAAARLRNSVECHLRAN